MVVAKYSTTDSLPPATDKDSLYIEREREREREEFDGIG